EWIGELNSLEELNLWGNQVETLPKSISLLSNLKVLDLSFNRLNQLPTFLSDFKKKSDLVIKL
ncbi:MAG: leucine-rich repeat domain-containing protein, partial [Promethearchaeota archaeon]